MSRKAKRYDDGEYMPLIWDGTPDFEAVYGHVTPEEFAQALAVYGREAHGIGAPRHLYARWVPVRGKDCDRELVFCGPGRGAFRLTVADYIAASPRADAEREGT